VPVEAIERIFDEYTTRFEEICPWGLKLENWSELDIKMNEPSFENP